MSNIYYAAPLHEQKDRDRNATYVKSLRDAGHKVYSPAEKGIWEDMVDERVANGINKDEATQEVRLALFKADCEAIARCDYIIAYFGERMPSEGSLVEIGMAWGLHKPVLLFNPYDWPFNIMPEFASHVFKEWHVLYGYINREVFN